MQECEAGVESILIVEDKKSMADMLKASLSSEGYKCIIALDGKEGIKQLQQRTVGVVVTDLKLPKKDGLEVLKAAQVEDPTLPVIIMTAYGTIEVAVEAMKQGAYDFITKPFDIDHLLVIVRRALEVRRLYRENLLLKEEVSSRTGLPRIIGVSAKIKDVVQKVQRVAPTKSTVLLHGESGTGKELFARAIHHLSMGKDNLFVPINCAAIPRELLESELFGHERGAFTGAETRKLGKFELAHKGTIFLDEIAELEMSLQAKLLRVLQDHVIERVGGTRPIQVEVRVIAASNKDLASCIQEGKFREDLYYRLNVFPIFIPPLRERRDDIPMLAEFFVNKYAAEMKIKPKTISRETMKLLMEYNWKGNVREIENTIERAMILADGDTILPEHISLMALKVNSSIEGLPMDGPLEETTKAALKLAETLRIRKALESTRWNKTRAAELLKISYKTLLTKIKEYQIE
ncbi:Response regulator of zinc sigma-54-dependent two-component system [hydrothermal vent metagenome]|uniref:Response regulator of zinc sigma-54-dependent two-component system n=1 Tax=hydrothermal vent metagenome TaxID=652676 RepID=A0A3B1CU37_9ZZZZ